MKVVKYVLQSMGGGKEGSPPESVDSLVADPNNGKEREIIRQLAEERGDAEKYGDRLVPNTDEGETIEDLKQLVYERI